MEMLYTYSEIIDAAKNLSKDQMNVLMHKMKYTKTREERRTESEINANAIAGTIMKYSGTCFSVFNSSTWIIDSGASEHMCFDSKSFLSMSPLPVL